MRDQNSLIKLSYVSVKIQSLFVTWIEILLSRRHINRSATFVLFCGPFLRIS